MAITAAQFAVRGEKSSFERVRLFAHTQTLASGKAAVLKLSSGTAVAYKVHYVASNSSKHSGEHRNLCRQSTAHGQTCKWDPSAEYSGRKLNISRNDNVSCDVSTVSPKYRHGHAFILFAALLFGVFTVQFADATALFRIQTQAMRNIATNSI